MYADPLVAKNDNKSPSVESRTYALTSFPTGSSSIRKNAETDTGLFPEWFKISHQVVGRGTAIRDRHMVRVEASSVDGTAIGTHQPVIAYAVFDIPRSFKGANIEYQLVRQLVGWLRDAIDDGVSDYTTNFARLLNGEF